MSDAPGIVKSFRRRYGNRQALTAARTSASLTYHSGTRSRSPSMQDIAPPRNVLCCVAARSPQLATHGVVDAINRVMLA